MRWQRRVEHKAVDIAHAQVPQRLPYGLLHLDFERGRRIVRHTVRVLPRQGREFGLQVQLLTHANPFRKRIGHRGAHKLLRVVLGLARRVYSAEANAQRVEHEGAGPLLLPGSAVQHRWGHTTTTGRHRGGGSGGGRRGG